MWKQSALSAPAVSCNAYACMHLLHFLGSCHSQGLKELQCVCVCAHMHGYAVKAGIGAAKIKPKK